MMQAIRRGKVPAVVLALFLVGLFATEVQANVRFFVQVMRNLQHYRVTGAQVSMDLEGSGTGNLEFNLSLPSRRNNIEEVLMAGYLSAAYAIDRTGLLVKTVYVTAIVVNDNGRLVVTSAGVDALNQLVAKELTPHDFIGTIKHLN